MSTCTQRLGNTQGYFVGEIKMKHKAIEHAYIKRKVLVAERTQRTY